MAQKNIIENSKKLIALIPDLSESELSDLIELHNRKYFFSNDPEITDEAFDKLVETLRFINPSSPILFQLGDSPKQPGDNALLVVHLAPMLSLEKVYDDSSFFKWSEKINGDLIAMPKIDGVACCIKYDKSGKIFEVSTRGDGRAGENISNNAFLIPDLLSELDQNLTQTVIVENYLEIRGEVFLPLSTFNERFSKDFSSPRNLAAGFLKLKEGDRNKNKLLRFFPYDLRGSSLVKETDKFELLRKFGFSVMPWRAVSNDQNAALTYKEFQKLRNTFDFEIDGVVYRANDLLDQRRLGETAHHPRYAIAYKFQGESAQTRLSHVEWSVARSGIITPIAIVEPVFVSGASITRASLHNIRIFSELDLREESLVEITRRGGVIPYLESVLKRKGASILIPDHCPSCGGPVILDQDFLMCERPELCKTVLESKMIHFCHALGIEGLGDKIIRKLIANKMLSTLGDIFRLTVDRLLNLERMGRVLAEKLVAEIGKKRVVDTKTFIKALGIREIGSNVSELLVNNFHTLDRIRELTVEDLLHIHGIGPSIAHSLVEGLSDQKEVIDDLLSEINVVNEEEAPRGNENHPLFNKSVVFTGTMAHLERKSAQKAVKERGGKTPDSISALVDFLVVGDEGSPLFSKGQKSTKQKTAEKLIASGHGIKIISETEFLTMLR